MKRFVKPLAIAGVAGAMALGAMTSSEARPRGWAAAGVGFAAGALVGAAAANAANSHYHGSYYHGGYYHDGGYAYAPAPGGVYYSAPAYDGYAYEPAPTYRYENRSRDFRERQFNASNS